MSLINIQNLTFAYEGSYDNVFENVSFSMDTDWKLGFTGRNGRGKTTFLNLLLDKYKYSGNICASVSFEYFPFCVSDINASTLDAVAEVCPDYIYWKLVREMNLLKISEDTLYRPLYTLSSGERTKILLAALFLKENSFLLIDEPTNHLDEGGRKIVSRYLENKKGFILVSHDRTFLDGCIDHILAINKNGIEIQQGNFSSWLSNKKSQDRFEIAENEKLNHDIKRLKTSAAEKSSWSKRAETSKFGAGPVDRGYIGHKAANMMKRSKSIEKRKNDAIEKKSMLLRNIENAEDLKLTQLNFYSDTLAYLSDVSIYYDDKEICKNISFSIEKGDRIALRGKNGSGKSSIIKLICDYEIPYKGTFRKNSGLKISYVSQDTGDLCGNLSDYSLKNNINESLFKTILRKLDFSREQFEKDIGNLSAGQKKKILIAKSLCQKSHLLIWDEPLNYIDVISRIQIENLLLEFQPTILFVEHDSAFREKIATKIIQL